MLARAAILLLTGAVVLGQAAPRAVTLIVTNATVVTMDGGGRVLSPGAVAIDGRDIVAVDTGGDRRGLPGERSIDARGAVVMPGLINTHTHAPMVLYRGLADDLALMDWLQKYIFRRSQNGESCVRSRRHAAGRAGDDPLRDHHLRGHVLRGGDRPRDQGRGCGVLGQTIIKFPVPDAKTPEEGLSRTERFIKEFARRSDRAGRGAARDVYPRGGDLEERARARGSQHVPSSSTLPRRRTR